MLMSKEQREAIQKRASFLLEKEFREINQEYFVVYRYSDFVFSFGYEPYEDNSTAHIKFLNKNEGFDIGWIALVRDNIKGDPNDPFNDLLIMIDYVKNNFDKITDYDYCKESRSLIHKYIHEHFPD